MSTAIGFMGHDKMINKPVHHRRNGSGELDVFEAARYFSGAEVSGFDVSRKAMKDETPPCDGRAARKSFDMTMEGPSPMQPQSPHQLPRIKKSIKEKKNKQPSSPGGRLASFLNSLFNQTSSKKKSKSTNLLIKDEEDNPGGRRKRRSSISHFHSINSTSNSINGAKPMHSSSKTGFRTPPPYSHTTTKVCKDLNRLGPFSRGPPLPPMGPQNETVGENRGMTLGWLDEKFKFGDGFLEKNKIVLGNGLLEKDKMIGCNGLLEKERTCVGGFPLGEKDSRRADEVEDGAESDSSSDLFELQNYDVGVYSNGLPVYETTHMESIRIGAPIASGIF